jgi:hypothetical protein
MQGYNRSHGVETGPKEQKGNQIPPCNRVIYSVSDIYGALMQAVAQDNV